MAWTYLARDDHCVLAAADSPTWISACAHIISPSNHSAHLPALRYPCTRRVGSDIPDHISDHSLSIDSHLGLSFSSSLQPTLRALALHACSGDILLHMGLRFGRLTSSICLVMSRHLKERQPTLSVRLGEHVYEMHWRAH